MSLRNLLSSAYGVGYDFVAGPAWIDEVRLDIAATFPPGTSEEQFRLMLLHLLEERLGLIAHLGTIQANGYALVVAKSGPRLESAAAGAPIGGQSVVPDPLPPEKARDQDGFPIMPGGPGVQKACRPGACRFRATSATMEELAKQLPCRCSIVDETHLPGRYSFVLTADVQKLANPQLADAVEADGPGLNPNPAAIGAQSPPIRGTQSRTFFTL